MRVRVSHITRKAKGGIAYRDEDFDSDSVRFGRSTDNEIHLPDPRANLQQAALSSRPGGLFVEAIGNAAVRHNGVPKSSATLNVGDTMGLGPYDLIVVDAPEGFDLAVTLEFVRPAGDELEVLKSHSVTSLAETNLSKRRFSWALSLIVLVLFLVLPVVGFLWPEVEETAGDFVVFDSSWISGEISDAHKFFGNDCGACHQKAFIQVSDSTCVACHTTIEGHAHADLKVSALEEERCAHCHKEHNGNEEITINAQSFCAECHGDLKAETADTKLINVTDFGTDHPEFSPTISKDPNARLMQRVALSNKGALSEQSNLKYPHDKHLVEKGVRGPEGPEKLICVSCHIVEPGGGGMLPINMETHCSRCHQLHFEPDRAVPHGDSEEAARVIREYYSQKALVGDFGADTASQPRRRPGKPLTQAELKHAAEWAEAKASEMSEIVFGASLCRECHLVAPPKQEGDIWRVLSPLIVDRWMPKSIFAHASHETMECVDCHEQAVKSKASTDVLLPDINSCRECHGGESVANKLPSTCTMCHVFHRPELEPMRPETGKMASKVGN